MSEWKMVPVEPTPEMVEAGLNAPSIGHRETASPSVSSIYSAMLSAAPQPEQKPVDKPMTKLNNALFAEQWDRLNVILGVKGGSIIDTVDEVERRLLTSPQPTEQEGDNEGYPGIAHDFETLKNGLKDPATVVANTLRGNIAKLTMEQYAHICGERETQAFIRSHLHDAAWDDDVPLSGEGKPKDDGSLNYLLGYLLTVHRRFGNTCTTYDMRLQWGANALHKRDQQKERIAELEAQIAKPTDSGGGA